ncbi:MAG: hypothetical protein ACK4OE_08350 [Acidovorax sp.]
MASSACPASVSSYHFYVSP